MKPLVELRALRDKLRDCVCLDVPVGLPGLCLAEFCVVEPFAVYLDLGDWGERKTGHEFLAGFVDNFHVIGYGQTRDYFYLVVFPPSKSVAPMEFKGNFSTVFVSDFGENFCAVFV